MYKFLTDRNVDFPEKYIVGKYWINPFTDTLFSLLEILKGKLDAREYIKSIVGHNIVNAIFQKGDMRPGLIYFLKLPFFVFTR